VSTIHPTPSGTRDVLPDEMRELHAIAEAVRGVFGAHGYGEVHTPALEYEQVLTRGDPAAADPAYKLFDEQGNVLVLRSDMTIPIARVVSTRYGTADLPLRFCYVAHAYRSVRPQRGQDREMLQAGIELVGVPGPDGSAETLTVLCEALDAAGLAGYRVGLGDASLYPALLDAHGVPAGARAAILHELQTRDFVGLCVRCSRRCRWRSRSE
jgi:ATP phosphoribosyltransferase regulatory subunit HisZ